LDQLLLGCRNPSFYNKRFESSNSSIINTSISMPILEVPDVLVRDELPDDIDGADIAESMYESRISSMHYCCII
jgi:hypothetical protein